MRVQGWIILFSLLVILVPIGYLYALQAVTQHSNLIFVPMWSDNTFNTAYQTTAFNVSLSNGWSIISQYNQTVNSSGFTFQNNTLVLYATFNGTNIYDSHGVSGIQIAQPIANIDTNVSSYTVVITHKESSNDSSLMFTFGLTDDKGKFHDGGWQRAKVHWTELVFDLANIYRGKISSISLRLTDNYNSSYAGGAQYSYVQKISVYPQSPAWKLVASRLSKVNLLNDNGVMTLNANEYLTGGTSISAERFVGSPVDPYKSKFLVVSIKTSSVNVAAKIILWTNPPQGSPTPYTVLLKTYNDMQWHTEVIDLSIFGLVGNINSVTLGFTELSNASNSTIFYSQLSFNILGQQ